MDRPKRKTPAGCTLPWPPSATEALQLNADDVADLELPPDAVLALEQFIDAATREIASRAHDAFFELGKEEMVGRGPERKPPEIDSPLPHE